MKRTTTGIVPREHGYTMVELMIAILIGLFLLAGLLTLVMGTRKTSTTQSQLAQLQDNERVSMTLMTNVIQQAGYFPDPTTYTSTSFGSEPSRRARSRSGNRWWAAMPRRLPGTR